MKWKTLSDESLSLIRQLERPVSFEQTTSCLYRLRELAEWAAISSLMSLLCDARSNLAGRLVATLVSIVNRIPVEGLSILDERMRSNWGYDSRRLLPKDVDRLHFQEDTAVLLGLASCVSYGYTREIAALRLDREITDGREVPFLLLRLSDWVDQIREAAERAIERRLSAHHRLAYLKCLPLVVRMQNLSRTKESRIFVKIKELVLMDPASSVRHALEFADRFTRRTVPLWAWAAIRPDDTLRQREIVEIMLQSIEPAPRLRVASWVAGGQMAPDLAREIAPQLMSDRFAAVRRASLAWLAAHQPELCLPALRGALLDSSVITRSVAQYYLPKMEPIDLRAFYREAVQQPRGAQALLGAIDGLGETGRAEDAELIVSLTHNAAVTIRKASIRAIGKLAPKEHIEILILALQDQSPRVSRDARDSVMRLASLIGPERLTTIVVHAKYLHTRLQVLALVCRLPKWQAITQFIDLYLLDDEGIAPRAKILCAPGSGDSI